MEILKVLSGRIASDKVFHDKAFNIGKNQKLANRMHWQLTQEKELFLMEPS